MKKMIKVITIGDKTKKDLFKVFSKINAININEKFLFNNKEVLLLGINYSSIIFNQNGKEVKCKLKDIKDIIL